MYIYTCIFAFMYMGDFRLKSPIYIDANIYVYVYMYMCMYIGSCWRCRRMN